MRIRKIFTYSRTTTAVLFVLVGTLSLIAAGSFTTRTTATSAKDANGTFTSIIHRLPSKLGFLKLLDGPTVMTDKADYPIGATVMITGSGWQAGETVTLQVTDDLSATDPNHEAHAPWTVIADANGNITSSWTVDADADTLTLTLTATGTVSGSASTTFTDANPSANLDQCANGSAPSPSTDGCDADASDWVNGNLGASKSFYREGDSIAYRMVFQNLTTGGANSHSVTIEWDTTKGGKHAIDYITTFNRTVADANPCLGIPIANNDPVCGTASTFPIPKDPQVDNGSGSPVSQIAGNFTIYGGTITSVSTPTAVGSTSCAGLTSGKYCYSHGTGFTGDKSAAITINFTASQSNPVLAWGGHIATRGDWGINNSAIAISGSPYHSRLIDLDGSGGNQDRSLSADAVFFPVQLTIVKETNPDKAPQATFTYNDTGADLPSSFTLTPPDGTTPDSKVFSLNDASTRTVTEADAGPTFSFTSLSCSSVDGGLGTSTPVISGAKATITPKEGEFITCTYVNTSINDTNGRIIVKKITDPSPDTTMFTFNPTGFPGASTFTSSFVLQNGDSKDSCGVGANCLAPSAGGLYKVTETADSNYTTTSNCTSSEAGRPDSNPAVGIPLEGGETVTCTFTNTKKATIIVKKHMVGGTDTFAFTGDPNGSISTDNGTIQETVVPGTYTSTETLKSGWDLNSVTCDDSDSVGSVANHNAVFHAAAGETVTCTFTNTKEATIIVKKHMIGGTDTFAFSGDPNGSISTDNGTIQEAVVPGTYTSTETLKDGWDLNSVSCDDSDSVGSVPNHNAVFHAAAGETITCTFTNTKRATITVKKHMIGGTDTFSFLGDPNGSINTDNGTIQESVAPGTYTSTETLKSGWDLNSVTCDDSDSVGSVANHNAVFHAAAGESITCTFTNTKEATIIVQKHMIGGTDTFAFTGDPNGSISTDNGTIFENVIPGTYTSTETLKTGWDLNSVTCDDSDSVGSVPNHNAVFHAAAGETITCTFTNTKEATIIVKKHMIGGTDTFSFTGDPNGPISADNGTVQESVVPGTYTSTETLKSGWDLNSVTCDDSDSVGSVANHNAVFHAAAGEIVTCTFTNTKEATIIVKKHMIGGTDTFAFTGDPNGSISVDNGTIQESVAPGTYTSTETLKTGWDLNSVTCDDADSAGSVPNHNAVFHAAAGEIVTCTFTNTKRATIIVKKHMVGGTDTFSFTGDPNGSISADNGTIQESVVPGAYSSVEGAKTGWDLNSVSCDDGNSTGDVGTRTASFNAEAGETVTCTFTNTKEATIIVKKHMIGGTDTFSFTGDPNGSISVDNGTISETVVPGTYTSTETLKTGWDLNSVTCDDSDSVGSVANHNAVFHAAAGETVTCTFTNTKEATIIVKKHMIGGTDTFAFTGDPSGSISTDNGTISESVVPGTYTSTETLKTGWDLNSVSCSDSDSVGSVASHNAVFHAAAGETVTCTFTNTLRATIIVQKHMIGGTDTFSFAGDPSGSISVDNGTISESVAPGNYTSTETLKSGWDLNSVSCDDSDSVGSVSSHNAVFHAAAGETVKCTFTNTKRGLAKVVKTFNGQTLSGTDSFTFELRSGASDSAAGTILESGTANAGNVGIINFATTLVPGQTYELCEQMQPGWLTTLGPPLYSVFNPSGDNSVVCTNFTVAAGETKEFDINNQPPPGGMGLTIGFWKNWASCAKSNGGQKPTTDKTLQLGTITLGSLVLTDTNTNPNIASDCDPVVNLLNKTTISGGKKMASDPIFNMVAQLVAADLNVLAGAGQSINAMNARSCAHALLTAINFNGNTYSKLTAAQTAQANCLATALDQYNNNKTVQACNGCP